VDLVPPDCDAAGNQRLGDSKTGQDMAGRPTSSYYKPSTTDLSLPELRFCAHGVWRAMFNRIPNAVRLRIVELPP